MRRSAELGASLVLVVKPKLLPYLIAALQWEVVRFADRVLLIGFGFDLKISITVAFTMSNCLCYGDYLSAFLFSCLVLICPYFHTGIASPFKSKVVLLGFPSTIKHQSLP